VYLRVEHGHPPGRFAPAPDLEGMMGREDGQQGSGTGGPRKGSVSSLERLLAQTDIPLFRGLTKRDLRRVARTAELEQHVGTVEIVRAGDPGDAFHVVVDGEAEYRSLDGDAGILRPGDYFGELALLDGAPRAASVISIGELTTLRISRSAFLALLKEEPVIGVRLLPGLVAIVRELEAKAL
jgi:CRP-like cAMP-binding protein